MLSTIFGKGLLMGFLTTLPLGPIAIIVIQRTINRNRWAGFFSGAGAAVSDSLYASVAGLSVSFVLSFITEYENIIRIIGAVILLSLGVVIFMSHPERLIPKNKNQKTNYFKDFGTTMLITISNPLVIFVHLAFFSALGIVLSFRNIAISSTFIFGFFMGALCWWFILTEIVNLFRSKFTMKICLWFNRIAGGGIILFVIVSVIVSFFFEL